MCSLTGSSVELSCSYPNNLEVLTEGWFIELHPNKHLEQMPSDQFGIKYKDQGNCTITLQDVQQSYETSYFYKYSFRNDMKHVKQCNGAPGIQLHVFAFAVSIVVERLVWTKGTFSHIDNGTVTEGQSIRLICVWTCAVKPDSNLAYIWYKNKLKFKVSKNPHLYLDPVSYEDMASYACVLSGYKDHPSPAFNLTVQRKPQVYEMLDEAPDGGSSTTRVPALCDSNNSMGPNNSSQKPTVKSLLIFSVISKASTCVGVFIVVMVAVVLFKLKKKKRKKRSCADSVTRPPLPSSDIYIALDISSMPAEYDTLDTMRHCSAADAVYENLCEPGEAAR